jgi:hypothetical protein
MRSGREVAGRRGRGPPADASIVGTVEDASTRRGRSAERSRIASGDLTGSPALTLYNGADCNTLFTASGHKVTADPSITLIFGAAHAGSCSGNNIPGGATVSKLSIMCASSNTIDFNCSDC